MTPFLLRPARSEDAETILRLEEDGMCPYAEALWASWQPSATPETLDLSGHEMIRTDAGTVGCVATQRHPDHLQIRKLYIASEHRRCGIGSAVLARIVAKVEEADLPIRLTVLTTNPALRFYLREGFHRMHSTAERHHLVREPVTPPASG